MRGIVFWIMEIIHLPEDNVDDTVGWDLLFDWLCVTPKKPVENISFYSVQHFHQKYIKLVKI